jgi:hypothetical protein
VRGERTALQDRAHVADADGVLRVELLDVEQVAALVLPEPFSCVVVEHVVVPPHMDRGECST